MSVRIRLKEASTKDLQFILDLLKSNNLCFEDIPQKAISLFVGYVDSEIVGIGGLEVYGKYALLRSLVIEEQFREKGYGKALCKELIQRAKNKGVRELYLLTATADKFFREIGFEKIKREGAPAAIQNTTEFKEMCPVSSTFMRKKDL
jgi:amino-acid N-acetyltransferase